MKNELKPCPFCGGKVKSREIYPFGANGAHYHMIECGFCGAKVSFLGGEKREAAIALWNSRAAESEGDDGN